MRNFVVLLFVTVISISTFASNENPLKVKREIRSKIVKLLGNADFTIDKDVKTTIDFLVNKKGEIVILNIECANPKVCSYVKNKLNYKKIANNNLSKAIKTYKMPLKIVKK